MRANVYVATQRMMRFFVVALCLSCLLASSLLLGCQAKDLDAGDEATVDERAGQSQGYVGPDGEGSYSQDDWSTEEEYSEVMQDVYREEYAAPHVFRDGYEEGTLLVSFRRTFGEARAREIVDESGGEWVSSDFKYRRTGSDDFTDEVATVTVYYPEYAEREELLDIAASMEERPEVEWAGLNEAGRSSDEAPMPDVVTEGAGLSQQYYLQSSCFDRAWEMVRCQGDVTVAIIDCGFDLDHPDLHMNIVPGYDATTQTPLTDSSADGSGHGTKVAGIVSAIAGNSFGIDGASYNARVIPIRHSSDGGSITWENVRRSLQYVKNHESSIQVVNMSFEFLSENPLCEALLGELYDDGVICVAAAAAGNWRVGEASSSLVKYPASYDGVISVSSIDYSDAVASDSNRNEYVDVCAPGVNVYTTVNHQSGTTYGLYYGTDSGTSFAAPQVAAAAALLRAQHPGWSAQAVENRLKSAARDLGPAGWDPDYGCGALDAAAAVGWSWAAMHPEDVVTGAATRDAAPALEYLGINGVEESG